MWKKLAKGFISNTTMNYIGTLMSTLHYLHPGLVNVLKPFCFLKESKRSISHIYLINFTHTLIKLIFGSAGPTIVNELLGKNVK